MLGVDKTYILTNQSLPKQFRNLLMQLLVPGGAHPIIGWMRETFTGDKFDARWMFHIGVVHQGSPQG